MDAGAVNSILEVTSQDIAYFKRGEMSPAVRDKIVKSERGCNRWLFIIMVASIAIIAAIVVVAKGDATLIIAGSAAPAIFGVGALLMLVFARNSSTNSEAMKVRQASGPARMSVSYHDGNKRYSLLVDKADFSIEHKLFEAIPEGANITVYFQKLSDRYSKLLGVESNE